MKKIKDYILMFLTFIIVFPLTQILLSTLDGEINYDINIVQTLSLGVLMTVFISFIHRNYNFKQENKD